MREILFRGKREDNGEWFYGDLQQNCDCVKIREKEIGKEPNIITSQGIKEYGRIAKSFVVIPETIGQYIWRKDKNGVRIFEGNILKLTNGDEFFVGEVVYLQTFLQYLVRDIDGYCTEINHLWQEIEVIGNIHDNPDLLKGGEQE